MGPKFKKFLIGVLVFVAVLAVTKNFIIKSVVTVAAGHVTGAKVSIDKLAMGVFRTSVQIKGFKMEQPKGFPNGIMVDIPEVRVDYDLLSVLQKKLHLKLVVLNLKELVVVRNTDGMLNVDALKVAQESKDKDAPKEKKKSDKMPLRIDEARLNLGKVVYKDYSKGEPPSVQAYDIGVKDKVYKDIKSAEQFATLVLVQAMGPTAIQGAKIYGAATLLGVGFLPAGVAGVLVGKDSGVQEIAVAHEDLFRAALATVEAMGELKTKDASQGILKAKIDGADVAIKIESLEKKKSKITVSARKFLIPKPELANGVLYQIEENL